jgi:hypothetical protein
MTTEDPLVLVFLRVLYRGAKYLFNTLSSVFWFPVIILHRIIEQLSRPFVLNKVVNPYLFWITIPFRYIMGVILVYPIMVVYTGFFIAAIHYLLTQRHGGELTLISIETLSMILTSVILVAMAATGAKQDKTIDYKV